MWVLYRRMPPWSKKDGTFVRSKSFAKFPRDAHRPYVLLCASCLQKNPKARPTFKELLADLVGMYSQLKGAGSTPAAPAPAADAQLAPILEGGNDLADSSVCQTQEFVAQDLVMQNLLWQLGSGGSGAFNSEAVHQGQQDNGAAAPADKSLDAASPKAAATPSAASGMPESLAEREAEGPCSPALTGSSSVEPLVMHELLAALPGGATATAYVAARPRSQSLGGASEQAPGGSTPPKSLKLAEVEGESLGSLADVNTASGLPQMSDKPSIMTGVELSTTRPTDCSGVESMASVTSVRGDEFVLGPNGLHKIESQSAAGSGSHYWSRFTRAPSISWGEERDDASAVTTSQLVHPVAVSLVVNPSNPSAAVGRAPSKSSELLAGVWQGEMSMTGSPSKDSLSSWLVARSSVGWPVSQFAEDPK